MPKQEYKSAIRSKALIKHALIKLISEKDIKKITVTEVIEVSGISRGTFYSHYKSLDDVINQIIDDEYNRLAGLVSDNFDIYFNPDNVLMLITSVFDYIEDDKDYYTNIILYSPIYDAIMSKIAANYKEKAISVLKKKNIINNEKEADSILIFSTGGIENEILKWAKFKIKLDAPIVVKILMSIFTNLSDM